MLGSYLCCRSGFWPKGQLLAILASQDLISRLGVLVPMWERHNGVALQNQREQPQACAGVLPGYLPPLQCQLFQSAHHILFPVAAARQYGVVLSHKALELLHVILLVSQSLDTHAFPGVSAPLNLVESLPCMTVRLSSQGIEFERPGIVGMWVWGNLPKLEEPRASPRERHGSLW